MRRSRFGAAGQTLVTTRYDWGAAVAGMDALFRAVEPGRLKLRGLLADGDV